MSRKLRLILFSVLGLAVIFTAVISNLETETETGKEKDHKVAKIKHTKLKKKSKKTPEQRMQDVEDRVEHELAFQRNPSTGRIPLDEKEKELEAAIQAKLNRSLQRQQAMTFTSRGPNNLGGRTRALAIDVSDNTSKTMLAGGVSSGLFRSTNGGTSWTRVSPKDEIHNVSALAQDPRPGFQNIWYYGTGEWSGNSASLASAYRGRGVWKSTDSGLTWTQISQTNSASQTSNFDSPFDYVMNLKVSPTTGDLFIATTGKVYRYDGTNMTTELQEPLNGSGWTDVAVTGNGNVYAAFEGGLAQAGVWRSPTGNGSWTRIANTGGPAGWGASGRIVLGNAPSNNNVIYALYNNGLRSSQSTNTWNIEADLWKYDAGSTTWTNYSSKLPDEPGGNSQGNDPFAIQGGYDLVVSVKPDNENYVVIGGVNAYKIENITTSSTFTRIGGYANNGGYALYANGGVQHHPDIHALVFDPNNANVLFSGTDGGVHRTANITSVTTTWQNLNNNYLTYQYYHVALDPQNGGNIVLGGAQDNGTTAGGTDYGRPDNQSMESVFSGDGVAVGIARRNSGAQVEFFLGFQNGRTFRLSNTGTTEITPTGSSSQFVTYFYLDPDNTETMYYAGRSTLYRNTDVANATTGNWDNLSFLGKIQDIRSMATTRGTYSPTSYLLIGGNSGGVFRLDDPKNNTLSSAVNITPLFANKLSGSIVSSVSVHPTNSNIAIATYANYGTKSIFITTNARSSSPTWTEVERNLSAHSIRSSAIAEVNGKTLYFVGTARGLYSSFDPTTKDWALESPNEVGLAVVSELVYRPSDKRLLIGTHGNGMYETTVVDTTLSTETLANNDLGASVFPSPAKQELNITGSRIDFTKGVNYTISDLTGRTVSRGLVSNQKVNVSQLNTGVYIINLESEGVKGSLKFIKE